MLSLVSKSNTLVMPGEVERQMVSKIFIGKLHKNEHNFWSNRWILMRVVSNREKYPAFEWDTWCCWENFVERVMPGPSWARMTRFWHFFWKSDQIRKVNQNFAARRGLSSLTGARPTKRELHLACRDWECFLSSRRAILYSRLGKSSVKWWVTYLLENFTKMNITFDPTDGFL